jgi:hypothetical protein
MKHLPWQAIPRKPGATDDKAEQADRMRAQQVADTKRRDAFARQAVKVKKVAARTVGSGRARGR